MELKRPNRAIYDELKKINKSNINISKTGNSYRKLFQKKSIQSFLDRHMKFIQEKEKQKNSLIEAKRLKPNKTYLTAQWNKVFNSYQQSSHSVIESSNPSPELNDLIQYCNKSKKSKENKKTVWSRSETFKMSSQAHNRFQIKPDLLIHLKQAKEKIPDSWHYNPNYSYIFPHVFVPIFKPIEPAIHLNKTSIAESKNEHKNYDSDNDDSFMCFNRNKNKSKETCKLYLKKICHKEVLDIRNNKSIIKSNSNIHALSFDNYSNRQILINKCIYKDSEINPNKLSHHAISAPKFDKMTFRDKKPLHPKMPVVLNYYPIYDSIEERLLSLLKKVSLNKSSSHSRIKQICSSYDVPKEYISVPSINK